MKFTVVKFTVVKLVAALTIGLFAAPLVAEGQQAGKVPPIGWLGGPTRESAEPFVQAFQRGLKDLGWVEGQNIVIEWRFAGGRAERLPDLAAELVRLQADVIVAPSTPTALAAKNATKTIPIVTVGGWRSCWVGARRQPGATRGEHHGIDLCCHPRDNRETIGAETDGGCEPCVGGTTSTVGGAQSQRLRQRLRGYDHKAR